MNYATAEQIVKIDSQFADGQALFERLFSQANLTDEELAVVEALLWSMLATAFIMGYTHRLQ